MENKLTVIDGETLMDMRLPPTRFCVQTLLPQGVTVLGGAPKVGKSWLVLDLCIRVAKGESIWNLPTAKGTTLYLCLEDTARRIQERLLCITDEVPSNAFFAVAAKTLADGLCEQVRQFVSEHPDTVLVVIDTFQMIRGGEADLSYANDYPSPSSTQRRSRRRKYPASFLRFGCRSNRLGERARSVSHCTCPKSICRACPRRCC